MGIESRLKVGLFFNARQEQGGLYQYALTLVDCLHSYAPEFDYYLYHATLEELPLKFDEKNWHFVRLPVNDIRVRMALELLLMGLSRFGFEILVKLIPEYRQINRNSPDIMLYVKPTLHVFQWGYPAIFPIHDLQHRFLPEFPEVSEKWEYRRREFMYKHSVPIARAILTDSETGKEDVLNCYGSDQKKIFPLPYIAPTFRSAQVSLEKLNSVRVKYNLPNLYLFYPAAFWLHKNHSRLVSAIAWLANEKEFRIPLVLAGSRHHQYEQVLELAKKLGVQDLVLFLGYVPDDDLAALYHQAFALVMPTFFGPTNIPILEAWVMGCPVITSDLRGIREQVGDAGLLVDPRDEVALANAIWTLFNTPILRNELIERGKWRVSQWTPELFARKLVDVIRYSVSLNI